MRRWLLLLTRNRGMGGLAYPLVLAAVLVVGAGPARAEAASWSYQEPAVPNEVLGANTRMPCWKMCRVRRPRRAPLSENLRTLRSRSFC
jgi:hypothetical protein